MTATRQKILYHYLPRPWPALAKGVSATPVAELYGATSAKGKGGSMHF